MHLTDGETDRQTAFLQLYRALHYCSCTIKFCIFQPPLGGLAATYDDHLRLIVKSVGDLLLVLIELFSLSVTAEEIQLKIGNFATTEVG